MQKSLKKTVLVGILSAMAFVLFLFPKFPILAAFPWLDLDLSDVPALFASVVLSPISGLLVALIKNLLHLAVTSTAMIGELSNFLINGTFVLAVGLLHRYLFKALDLVHSVAFSLLLGSVFQVIAAVLVNFFLMIPMYSAFVNFSELGGAETYILAGVIPFNLIKDVAVSFVTLLLFRLLYRKFHGYLHK